MIVSLPPRPPFPLFPFGPPLRATVCSLDMSLWRLSKRPVIATSSEAHTGQRSARTARARQLQALLKKRKNRKGPLATRPKRASIPWLLFAEVSIAIAPTPHIRNDSHHDRPWPCAHSSWPAFALYPGKQQRDPGSTYSAIRGKTSALKQPTPCACSLHSPTLLA